MTRRRSIDARAPFLVWASADDAGSSLCDHGIWVDSSFAMLHAEPHGVVLSVRAAERGEDGSVYATTAAVKVICSLDTARCIPTDDDAAAFLAEHTWFESRLEAHMDLVRGRVERVTAQRDRDTSARRALASSEPGKMIAFEDLFPFDWDLLIAHDGEHYWGVDQYCSNPSCDCSELVVTLHRVRDKDSSAPTIGRATLDLSAEAPTIRVTSSLALEVFKKFWAEHEVELRPRASEARRAILRYGLARATSATRAAHRGASSSPTTSRTSRNAPCHCGSGKKFKRCCLNARRDDGAVDARPVR